MTQPTQSLGAPRQLRRSRTDRYLGGVCGGVAKYLNMDPTLVRILTVVLTLFTAVPAILYVVALFVMPEEDVVPTAPTGPGARSGDAVWGAGGPPWAPTAGAEPQAPGTSSTFQGTVGSPAAEPGDPRPQGSSGA